MTEPIHHAVTIPSKENAPAPHGSPRDMAEGAAESPSPGNPWICAYPCTVAGHTDTVQLLWNGLHFSLSEADASDPAFGMVDIAYDPPLHA